MRRLPISVCLSVCAAGLAAAQSTPGSLLSIYRPQVKLDRRLDFEASVERIAKANRTPKGARWVATAITHGADAGTYSFSSRYQTWADLDAGSKNMREVLNTAFGAGAPKFFTTLDGMLVRAISEVRRSQPELSVAALNRGEGMKVLAGYRMLRSIRIELKPGKAPEFIEAWKPWQAELEKMNPRPMALVSVTSTGPAIVTVTAYLKGLGDLDTMDGAIRQVLAGDVYRKFQAAVGNLAYRSSWELHRFIPELSSVDDDLIAADSFWKPKPAAPPAKKKQ